MCVVHDKLIDFYMDKVASFIAESQSHYSAQHSQGFEKEKLNNSVLCRRKNLL